MGAYHPAVAGWWCAGKTSLSAAPFLLCHSKSRLIGMKNPYDSKGFFAALRMTNSRSNPVSKAGHLWPEGFDEEGNGGNICQTSSAFDLRMKEAISRNNFGNKEMV
jgi:hypothetical protein